MTEIVEKKESSIESKKIEKPKTIYRIEPTYYTDYDFEKKEISIEVHLPGVPKENVNLKILPEFWYLKAFREEEKSKANYILKEYFPVEIKPDSTQAEFNNGLLKFTIKIKDRLEDAIDIKLE